MIYCFYGNNIDKIRERSAKFLGDLKKNHPEAAADIVSAEELSLEVLTNLAKSQDLFAKRRIVTGSGWFSSDAADAVLSAASRLVESSNIFVLREGALNKKITESLIKVGAKLEKHETEKKADKAVFNVFSLADAFGRRDKKSFWISYQKAAAAGVSAEEIYGVIMWQTKTMLLVKKEKTAITAGLKPFVFTKATNFSKNYSEDELGVLSSGLVALYHNARRGEFDLADGLEKFILSL